MKGCEMKSTREGAVCRKEVRELVSMMSIQKVILGCETEADCQFLNESMASR